MLHMLDRNRRIKERPEKFQESKEQFDVILTCEEKCYDLVIANFEEMGNTNEQPVHVINIDIVSPILYIIFYWKPYELSLRCIYITLSVLI